VQLVRRWQQALKQMADDGSLARIQQQWLPQPALASP
jgi:ABC-type amino acid transport substrate-binding protein